MLAALAIGLVFLLTVVKFGLSLSHVVSLLGVRARLPVLRDIVNLENHLHRATTVPIGVTNIVVAVVLIKHALDSQLEWIIKQIHFLPSTVWDAFHLVDGRCITTIRMLEIRQARYMDAVPAVHLFIRQLVFLVIFVILEPR